MKTPEEKLFIQNRRMTNIVLAWCFLLDFSVSVIRLKGIPRHDCFIRTQPIYSVKPLFEEANIA